MKAGQGKAALIVGCRVAGQGAGEPREVTHKSPSIKVNWPMAWCVGCVVPMGYVVRTRLATDVPRAHVWYRWGQRVHGAGA